MCSDCGVFDAIYVIKGVVYVLWLWCVQGSGMGSRVICALIVVCAREWHGLFKVSYRLVTQGSGIGCLRQ
jgi:hypothetical protein